MRTPTRIVRHSIVAAIVAFAIAAATGLTPQPASAEPVVPDFPGAEGFGAVATGGRGGRVDIVTTLEPFGPGSLGDALAPKNCAPRTIVFPRCRGLSPVVPVTYHPPQRSFSGVSCVISVVPSARIGNPCASGATDRSISPGV